MLTKFKDDPDLLKTFVTDDKSWVYGYNIPMEASRRAKTEKSISSSIKCEGFAHCFLRLQWRGAARILIIRSWEEVAEEIFFIFNFFFFLMTDLEYELRLLRLIIRHTTY